MACCCILAPRGVSAQPAPARMLRKKIIIKMMEMTYMWLPLMIVAFKDVDGLYIASL
jgi:hypothetical protein